MAFEKLHPALQYHIVNSIGWTELREVQEACIEPILTGQSLVVQAHTAGGKTEAAFFPLLSRMLAEKWTGLSILYLSPIRALLNNQESRLRKYFGLVGHRADVWHGDVTASSKQRLVKDLPSCLLTTPESLEAILTSGRIDHNQVFADLHAIVIDEVHAFAGDDRGHHLMAILSRLTVIAGRQLQRIGLSATVGNPVELAGWLAGGAPGEGTVIRPEAPSHAQQEVTLDYVGNLNNAAKLISELHAGEKRLVFCDSRAMVEELGSCLRELGIRTFVTHSSLSRDLRRQAETAFQEESNCVICATSALELGIDIGDLDRVIQINSPGTVAGFLQRMGRTGRRNDAASNCLFLALDDEALLDCATLIQLWQDGYIEPVHAPPLPYHIFAQQVMALAMQNKGIGRGDWKRWLLHALGIHELGGDEKDAIIQHMLNREILAEDQGILWFGREGEKVFGRKNFMELLSVFTSPPMMTVRHGQTDLGIVDRAPLEMMLLRKSEEDRPAILTLSGRHWLVVHVDWRRSVVIVREAPAGGRSRWLGQPRIVSFEFSQARAKLLCSQDVSPRWSTRAKDRLRRVREDYAWYRPGGMVLRQVHSDRWLCWTFCGTRANAALADLLHRRAGVKATPMAHSVALDTEGIPVLGEPLPVMEVLSTLPEAGPMLAFDPKTASLKFGECVPDNLMIRTMEKLWHDRNGWGEIRNANLSVIALA